MLNMPRLEHALLPIAGERNTDFVRNAATDVAC